MALSVASKTFLQREPTGFRINVNSFQQDAITSFNGAQYVVAYQLKDETDKSPRLVTIGRRILRTGHQWEFISFTDYEQVTDDGHNVVTIGISGDGVIHLAWDLHNDLINYRTSVKGLASDVSNPWSLEQFGPVQHSLSGVELSIVTYPRFLRLPQGDLLFEFRIGKSGLGDDYLYRYSVSNGKWMPVGPHNGMYLKGVENNAYINGIDIDGCGRLHVSWTYRDYVEDRPEFLDPAIKAVATRNAGPNGPENNHDFYYIYSDDFGISWRNTFGEALASPVMPNAPGIKIYEIPKFSGIMNQEGQAVEKSGIFHALNRQDGFYYHYWRALDGTWSRGTILGIPAVSFGNRGQLVARSDGLYALLPGASNKFMIARSTGPTYDNWKIIWESDQYDGEPGYDRYMCEPILSVIQISVENGRKVVVMDFKK